MVVDAKLFTVEPAVELNPVEGVQVQLVPPVADKLMVSPIHNVGLEVVTAIVGALLIVTVTVVDPEQPLSPAPVTVQVVVAPGLAVTDEPEPELKPVEGNHEKLVAPDADSLTLSPLHIAGALGDTDMIGFGITVTTIATESIQPVLFVPATIYVDVATGLAITDEPEVALNPVEGLQV